MKVLLLNGPPSSGKDTIGEMLWGMLPHASLAKFAKPIVDFMMLNYSINMAVVAKDLPHPALNGRTPREVAIAYSERFCKPTFGVDYFGQKALAHLRELEEWRQQSAIFTDSGFVVEVEPLIGKHDLLQVRLARPGRSYVGDSRSTWSHPGIPFLEFDNDSPTTKDLDIKLRADLLPEILKWLKN